MLTDQRLYFQPAELNNVGITTHFASLPPLTTAKNSSSPPPCPWTASPPSSKTQAC